MRLIDADKLRHDAERNRSKGAECMAQSREIREQVKRSYRMVDLCFGPHDLWRFPELLRETISVHGLPGNRGRVFSVSDEDAVAEGDLLKAGDLEAGTFLDHFNVGRCFGQGFVRASVQPGETTA